MFRAIGSALFAALFLFAGAVRADEAEDKAVKVIESAGGQIVREASLPGKPILGVVMPQKFGPNELKALASFKRLLALSLSGPGVNDAVLKEIAALKTLRQLVID